MSNRKGGKKGKDKNTRRSENEGFIGGDDVLEFTPQGGFNIHAVARRLSVLMRESCQDLVMHLPHVSVEFEAGCTPQEIIDGYNQAMRRHAVMRVSNSNLELV